VVVVYLLSQVIRGLMTTRLNWKWIKILSLSLVLAVLQLQH